MFIFRGVNDVTARHPFFLGGKTLAYLAGSEHFGVGGGHVRIEFNWKCGDALGAAFGVSGRKSGQMMEA